MIYRIHPNIKDYLMLHLDGDKTREALGDDTDFHIDERPISYLKSWKKSEVDFVDSFGGRPKMMPDISMNIGKLFLSEKAYKVLYTIISACGEFLPISYNDNNGYIFNCLKSVENDNKLSTHNPLNDMFSIVFNEDDICDTEIFRSKIDTSGYFCSDNFKQLVEKNQLTGISFSVDLGNPFPEELEMKVAH